MKKFAIIFLSLIVVIMGAMATVTILGNNKINDLNSQIEAQKKETAEVKTYFENKISTLKAEYQSKVAELEQKYKDNAKAIADLTTDYEGKISEIEKTISTLDSKIDSEILKLIEKYDKEIEELKDNSNLQGLDFYLKDDDTYAAGVGNAIYLRKIVIPEKYNGRAVTAIVDYGFKNLSKLQEIEIPNSVNNSWGMY